MSPIRLRVRELREAQGWTQEELALRAGSMRIATISALENDRVGRVELSVVERLAEAFGVEPGFLFIREGKPARGKKS